MNIKKILLLISIFFINLYTSIYLYSDEIHELIKSGIIEKIKDLLDINPSLLNLKDSKGRTAVYWSSLTGNLEITELLLRRKADLNISNNDGLTPLHAASRNGWQDVVKLLLENGANVNVKENTALCMPLHLAAGGLVTPNTDDEAKLLMGTNFRSKGLQIAVIDNKMCFIPSSINSLEVVKLLISKGATIDVLDKFGQTPLFDIISQNGNSDIIKFLLSKGANPNIKNNHGRTPLHEASYWGNALTVNYLVENNADVNAKDKYIQTPLHLAASSSFEEGACKVIEILLKKGSSINALTFEDWTPLAYANAWHHKIVAKFLMERGGKDIRGKR